IGRNVKLAEQQLAEKSAKVERVREIETQAAELAESLGKAAFERRREVVKLVFPKGQGCAVVLHGTGDIEARGILPVGVEGGVEMDLNVLGGRRG
ncbi:MAG TPA: hypothetical protein VHP33_33425, partial [Polyangiaceae bacterium]|nr:hypothetical protein [Polyangiaceae bacterium]